MTGYRDVSETVRISLDSDARQVATDVYDQLLSLLDSLEPADWNRPTDCEGWDVSAMVGHLIGAARFAASLREMLRQQRWGVAHKAEYGGNSMDAFNDLQIRDHAHLTPPERVAALRDLAPLAVNRRMGTLFRLGRRLRFSTDPGGSTPAGSPSSVTLGELTDVVLTRDAWLHTVDIARATDRMETLTSPVNRRIVEDVVAEWTGRHGRPFRLTLTGPAGEQFQQGDGGDTFEMDAFEFCRVLSGRSEEDGLLATRVLF